ncbi:hypothetical protein HMPREF9087_1165 [Enterococcus casseliflavus ATCC 12755]|uniref:Uncharacterized protein n=1 Tax=Enterococcus casseliflavus ATCC 12755 TaxID=888066 RepID=F0EJG9_ENTCA|nr:hypothetical protein HMPREF9087_1165 [Enterococcus casseliflavus ATCC 12755]
MLLKKTIRKLTVAYSLKKIDAVLLCKKHKPNCKNILTLDFKALSKTFDR